MKQVKNKLSVLVIISILILGYQSLFAQSSGPKTVFWEITGNGLEQPSYLFGTIHILPKSEFEPYALADEKLKESEQLILEMNLDVPMKTKLEWAGKMMLPEGKTIPDYMDEQEFSRLKSYALDSLDIKNFLFKNYIKMKPFAFYSALIPHVIGKKIEGYDMYYSNLANKEDIPVVGLESFEFQLAIFDSISYEKQLEMFFSGEYMEIEKEMRELLDMYLSHDIYAMAEAFHEEETNGYEEFESELIIKRNSDWVDKLAVLMREKPSFIAVGAGHLAGRHGLIKKLREKGYTVEPIMLNDD